MSKKVKVIDGQDQSKDRSMVIIQSAAEIGKENKGSNIEENEDGWFKQGERSMTQDKRYMMDGWELFPLGKMQE